MPNNRREKIPEGTLCVVCQDLASGIHYSVASCNGCKTFFRRALVNKQTFQCQFNGDCLVGKSVRCVCRSCRLKKCFEMGMDPKAIQHDRDKIRYTKALRKQKEAEAAARKEAEEKERIIKEEVVSPKSVGTIDYCPMSTPSSSSAPWTDFDLTCDPSLLTEIRDAVKMLVGIEEKLAAVRTAYRFELHTSATWSMYSDCWLINDDWVKQHSAPLPGTQTPQPCSLNELRIWFVRDLTLMMEWIKSLPYCQKMLLNDKAALMRTFACAYPVLQLSYYTKDQTVYSTKDSGAVPVSPNVRGLPKHMRSKDDGVYIRPDCTTKRMKKEDKEKEKEKDCQEETDIEMETQVDVESLDEVMEEEEEAAPADPSPIPQVLNRLTYPDGQFVQRDPDNEQPDELYMLMLDGVWRILRRNQIDVGSFVLYKLLVFFNTDVEGLSEGGRKIVQDMRVKLLSYLYNFLASERGREGHLAFANLLMMNSSISRIANSIRQVFTMDYLFTSSNDLVDQLIISGL